MTWLRAVASALDPYPRPMDPTVGPLAEAEAAAAAERALMRQSGVLDHLPGPALDPIVFGPPQ